MCVAVCAGEVLLMTGHGTRDTGHRRDNHPSMMKSDCPRVVLELFWTRVRLCLVFSLPVVCYMAGQSTISGGLCGTGGCSSRSPLASRTRERETRQSTASIGEN